MYKYCGREVIINNLSKAFVKKKKKKSLNGMLVLGSQKHHPNI